MEVTGYVDVGSVVCCAVCPAPPWPSITSLVGGGGGMATSHQTQSHHKL